MAVLIVCGVIDLGWTLLKDSVFLTVLIAMEVCVNVIQIIPRFATALAFGE